MTGINEILKTLAANPQLAGGIAGLILGIFVILLLIVAVRSM